MALLTTNTMHPCINHQPRTAPTPDPLTDPARTEADIVQGSCNSVMLIGMTKSPALPGVRGTDLPLVVLIVVALLGLLADSDPMWLFTGPDQCAWPCLAGLIIRLIVIPTHTIKPCDT